VPQQVADLFERGTAPQHLCRQAVAKLMGAAGGCLDPGPPQRVRTIEQTAR
jgi:hypothetical protein